MPELILVGSSLNVRNGHLLLKRVYVGLLSREHGEALFQALEQ